ncbi:P-loop containing nucleoside triphosphate hydrolase protein [Xylariomycetidae sp. FL0641]|nr:P-loop containing nucleoside triphosphate hydrolase protein [Xylariomycetidae sp. FL0641]
MPMKSLATFITAELGHLIGLRLKIQEGSLESVAFEELYHLYSPGDIIVDNRSEFEQLQQVYAVTGGRQRLSSEEEADDFKDGGEGTWTDFVLDCLEMRWNGTHIGPSRKIRRISPYTGQRKVMELECYPVQFHEKHDELCKSLTERGRKVVQCHGHKEYDGVSAKEPELSDRRWRAGPPPPYGRHPEPSRQQSLVKELSGDVYVDVQSFHKERYNEFTKLGRARPSRREVEESGLYRIKVTSFTDHAVDQRRSDQFLSDNLHLTAPQRIKDLKHISPDCLRLLPHSVPGYYLRQREWVWLDIDTLEEIDKSQQARTRGWEDLVIDEGYSGLLLPLVDNHNFAVGHKRKNVNGHNVPTAQIDLVKGKGRGLIILLHGPPGTGKTSTAEAIAAYTGKPLYAITCGDIGTDPENVERNLLEHMQRAEQWGCVLLLDEADVFLAKRTWTDIRRNALVSVFLRHLEYYSGILFLTTNIVGIIDEAFKSRIHVALRYDAIDLGTTKKIWSNVLNRILKDNEYADVQIMFKRTALLEFAEWHYEEHEDAGTTWNARQIRNAFSIAIAMAQFDRLERISEEGLTPEEVDSWPPKKKKTKGSLTMVHLKRKYFAKIADTAADFEDYINAVRGADTENALANHQRNDYFGRMTTPMRKDYHAQTSRGSEQGASRRRAPAKTPSSRASRVEKKTRRRLYSSDEDEEEGEEPEGEAEEEDDDIGKAGKGKASAQRKKKAVFSDDEDLEE